MIANSNSVCTLLARGAKTRILVAFFAIAAAISKPASADLPLPLAAFRNIVKFCGKILVSDLFVYF